MQPRKTLIVGSVFTVTFIETSNYAHAIIDYNAT